MRSSCGSSHRRGTVRPAGIFSPGSPEEPSPTLRVVCVASYNECDGVYTRGSRLASTLSRDTLAVDMDAGACSVTGGDVNYGVMWTRLEETHDLARGVHVHGGRQRTSRVGATSTPGAGLGRAQACVGRNQSAQQVMLCVSTHAAADAIVYARALLCCFLRACTVGIGHRNCLCARACQHERRLFRCA